MRAVEIVNGKIPMSTESAGSLFHDLSSISPDIAGELLAKATSLLPDGVAGYQTGSTYSMVTPGLGRPKDAHDMDIMVDIEAVGQALGVTEVDPKKRSTAIKKALVDHLKDSAKKQGLGDIETKLYGINVGIALPYRGRRYQVDYELVRNPAEVHSFHRHSYTGDGFKGMHKQRLLASIARKTITRDHPHGLAWSAFEGLKTRIPDPKKPGETKTGELITSDPNRVAKMLLGQQATASDLSNVMSILKALAASSSEKEFELKTGDAREEFAKDPNSPELPKKTDLS